MGGATPRMAYNVVYVGMNFKKPFKILALLLAFSLTGGTGLQAFADYGSPCCGSKACHPTLEQAGMDICHFAEVSIKEIKNAPCSMNRVPSVEGLQGVCLTSSRAQRPAPGVHAVLFYELSPLSSLFEGPVRRPLNLAQAPPESLYLQNLTLLI
jgi:hypothetical protein